MQSKFKHCPSKPKHDLVSNAYVILCNTHDATSSFLDIFETMRRTRNAKGIPTDEEQDLLRAMLIFATSGLDAMIKQLITDALPTIIKKDNGAKEVFKSHIEKEILKNDRLNAKLLVSALVEKTPGDMLIQELIKQLTADSLQSKDELLKVASYFNIPSNELSTDFKLLKNIFDTRNQIAHEMDINFSQAHRNRRPRGRDDMITYTTEILRIASEFLKKVDGKL